MDSSKSVSTGGLQTVLDVIVAPAAAFERLRVAPTWGWAFAIAIVCYTVTSYLITPALIHSIQASWPAMIASNPRLGQLTPEQQQNALGTTVAVMHYAWLAGLFVAPIASWSRRSS